MDPMQIPDDILMDIATTCSNRAVALAAEITLRKKHPSKVKIERKPKQKERE